MKLIIGLLTVCGLAAAQSAQAPSPVQLSTGNTAQTGTGSMPIYGLQWWPGDPPDAPPHCMAGSIAIVTLLLLNTLPSGPVT